MLRPIRVLLVDDNAIEARLVGANLADLVERRFEIERVGRLSDAIARVPRDGYDVVLLDLTLPDSQGRNTFDRVMAAQPTAPVIVYSGLDDLDLGEQLVRDGASDYLVKGELGGATLARALVLAIARASRPTP